MPTQTGEIPAAAAATTHGWAEHFLFVVLWNQIFVKEYRIDLGPQQVCADFTICRVHVIPYMSGLMTQGRYL